MIYQWRYQLPTDVVRHSPGRARQAALKAAVRDALRDGWHQTADAAVRMCAADGLKNVTDVTVAFAVAQEAPHVEPEPERETFAPGPLVELVEGRRGVREAFDGDDALCRAYYRGVERGVFNLRDADRLAVALGHTLETVWCTRAVIGGDHNGTSRKKVA